MADRGAQAAKTGSLEGRKLLSRAGLHDLILGVKRRRMNGNPASSDIANETTGTYIHAQWELHGTQDKQIQTLNMRVLQTNLQLYKNASVVLTKIKEELDIALI